MSLRCGKMAEMADDPRRFVGPVFKHVLGPWCAMFNLPQEPTIASVPVESVLGQGGLTWWFSKPPAGGVPRAIVGVYSRDGQSSSFRAVVAAVADLNVCLMDVPSRPARVGDC